jgi:hypothetical protein
MFEREIRHADGSIVAVTGRAVIAEAAEGWTYVERGRMTLPTGQVFEAERRYLWQPREGAVEIRFDDGRPFHTLPLTGGQDAHWCDPDQYDVTYDMSDWPRWQAVWRVRGPRKDYKMTTCYR